MGPTSPRNKRVRVAGGAASALACVGMVVAALLGPLREWHRIGSHDWDQMEAHRYLMVKSILRFGQLPFWDPYACGGHPSWAGPESGTALVSPFLPAYLFLPLAAALRVELLGSTLLSAAGTALFVGRLTRSAAAQVFACAIFVINTRWAFQAAAGHTWHLYYAWLPWALWSFDVATAPDASVRARGRMVTVLAASFAMMVYTGAIYALPQGALLLLGIAVYRALRERRGAPLTVLAMAGLLGAALAAPKLLPTLDTMRRYPRTVESPEVLDLGPFVRVLTQGAAELSHPPVHFAHWGLHEYAMYIGPVAAATILVAVFASPAEPKVRALTWFGCGAMLLGLGSFHEYAPWPLLHMLPVFKSQHVPSRWMYPGILLLAGVAAAAWERARQRAGSWSPMLEVVGWTVAIHTAAMVVGESQPLMREAFPKAPAMVEEKTGGFVQTLHVPAALQYTVPDWAPAALPAHIANVGVIECITFPGLNGFAPRDANGRIMYLGARGADEPEYRGEVFLPDGRGEAKVVRWTPNVMVVDVHGARSGDIVVLNQNWDESWTANGDPTIQHNWTNAHRLGSGDEKVEFRYRPRTFVLGCCLALLGIVAAVGLNISSRRRARWMARLRLLRPNMTQRGNQPAT